MSEPQQKPDWWTSDDWSTPIEVFRRIADTYGPFDLDPCCREETAKAQMFYTKADDGLARDWFGCVYVNPPYSDPAPWIRKALRELESGACKRVVMLLPASIDTGWYHELVLPYADVVTVRGRIRFIGWQGTPIGSPKAGNVIAIFPKRAAETFDARQSYESVGRVQEHRRRGCDADDHDASRRVAPTQSGIIPRMACGETERAHSSGDSSVGEAGRVSGY